MDPMNNTAKFNNANSLVKLGKNDEAIRLFENIIMNTGETELKGKVYYNMGVIFSSQKQLEQSIEAYKNALRQNPNDTEARENLQKALQELKKKSPPPKEDKKKKQQQQPQQQKMDIKEAEQRLKLLEQKEKEVMQRAKKESKAGNQQKDW
jgi:tetratricopeptide (TPR) repeat protein